MVHTKWVSEKYPYRHNQRQRIHVNQASARVAGLLIRLVYMECMCMLSYYLAPSSRKR